VIGVRTWRFTMWRRIEERPQKTTYASLALVPIEAPPLPMASGLSLIAPHGYRVEGLGLDEVLTLLRELA
jgi:hypothetical protein